jgi:fructokinase
LRHRIGIDLGGTKIEAVRLDPTGAPAGTIAARPRVPTPREDYPATLSAIADLVRQLDRPNAPASVGIGMPGTLSRATGLVKNANSTWLIGKPLDRDIAALINRPVRVANDADCFALSEAVDGAAAGASIVFGVILGTGVGGGLIINARPVVGPNGITGEWGHNPLPWAQCETTAQAPDIADPALPCYCGKSGCIESFLSGPGFAAHHRARTGQDIRAEDIVARAGQGDPAAAQSLAQYESRLARALAHVINIIDPDVIVLGGGLSSISQLYESIPKIWNNYVFSDCVATKLVPPVHGDSAGVRGAAWLWDEPT